MDLEESTPVPPEHIEDGEGTVRRPQGEQSDQVQSQNTEAYERNGDEAGQNGSARAESENQQHQQPPVPSNLDGREEETAARPQYAPVESKVASPPSGTPTTTSVPDTPLASIPRQRTDSQSW